MPKAIVPKTQTGNTTKLGNLKYVRINAAIKANKPVAKSRKAKFAKIAPNTAGRINLKAS